MYVIAVTKAGLQGNGKVLKLLTEALAETKLHGSDASAIQAIADKLVESSDHLFYIERLFNGLEDAES